MRDPFVQVLLVVVVIAEVVRVALLHFFVTPHAPEVSQSVWATWENVLQVHPSDQNRLEHHQAPLQTIQLRFRPKATQAYPIPLLEGSLAGESGVVVFVFFVGSLSCRQYCCWVR